MSDLLSRIEKLSANRRKLLELKKAEKLKVPALTRANREGPLPLSFAQQRLWFTNQLAPGDAAYNIPMALRIQGRLDLEIFGKAVTEIVRRHEILRTTYRMAEGDVRQEVGAAQPLIPGEQDLRSLAEDQREKEAERLAREEAQRPFDLERGPLVRVGVLRLAEAEYVVLVTMHHIVSDGWSRPIFVREFGALYQAYLRGEPSPLPEMQLQYADYAVWQRGWLQGEVLERQLEYWRKQLAELDPLNLPADHARPAVMSGRGAAQSFSVGKELAAKLQEFSRREGATLFMTLLAAFQIVLSKFAGQRDVAVGTDIANRTRLESEGLIGFFVNQLVLRVRLEGSQTFRDVVKIVRRSTLEAYQHQDVPFERLVEDLAPERELNRAPLFQVKLVLQNVAKSELELPGLRLSQFLSDATLAKLDLQLTLGEDTEGLAGELSYSTDLYDAASAERLLTQMHWALEQMAGNPDQTIGDLSLLHGAERERVLGEWNHTEVEYPRQRVHQLFEAQAAKTPQNVSVEFEGRQVSYEELNRRANQLGHYLRKLGVGPEVSVGICVERGIEMIVGLLGILKSGGAYVPLDPGYPSERLGYMLEDAQVPVLLTQAALRDGLPAGWVQVVCVDEDWVQIGQEPESDPPSEVSGENLAYVIYTSGSSGKPKGVGVTHSGLTNYLSWALTAYRSGQGSGSVVHSSLSFDLTVTSIYPALLSGGCVTVLPQAAGVEELARCLETSDYSLLKLTPSHLQVLAGLLEKSGKGIRGARALVIGGEALKYSDLEAWRKHAPETRLINEYGPTETVVGCVIYEVGEGSGTAEVPVGRPISNTSVYVLDENLEAAPLGAVGELYLGGAGLARGYLNRPDLTAEKFVPNLFARKEGERLYRTGDLSRWRADGNLEFLGRVDHQVKIRGFRIELGEIEAALLGHENVEQAVVVVRGTGTEQQLVAYVVSAQRDAELSVSPLREYLSERLPEYMVPSAFVPLEALPLTPNGKVDRKALPEPKFESGEGPHQGGPRNAEEEILSGIFTEVLKRERIGIEQNFFEAGGHSLLATQVVSRAGSAFGIELPLRALFESPTVAGLAQRVKQARGSGEAAVPRLLPAAREGDLPLSYSQQRLWFLHQLEPESVAYNMPLGVRFSGELNREALEWGLNALMQRHEVLRTSFAVRNGEPIQVIRPEPNLKVEVADLRDVTAGEREAVAESMAREESTRPFDLAQGPLLRARLLQLEDHEHVLLVTMHHIVTDGWSQGIIVREFAELYSARVRGEQPQLPEMAIQYADFAVWQRKWLQGEVLENQLGYWRSQLAGLQPLELPTDYPRPAVMGHRGARVRFEFPDAWAARLKEMCRREDATLFMALLAGFQILLARYSGQQDIAVGTPIANRTRMETEGLIGFFLNTLVLRTDLGGEPTFRQLLARVRNTALGAYTHQAVPFEKLVEEMEQERDLSRSSLFQVMLVLQNLPQEQMELSGLKLTPLAVSAEMSKFDLTLTLIESEENLKGVCTYRTDLFDPTTIERMMRHWESMMEAVVADGEQSVADMPLLSGSERRQLVEEWNDTAVPYEITCIHGLIERQAQRNPEAAALACGSERMNYRELNRRANQLGHYLRKLGVGPEMRVGLHMERSIEMVVGVLGILKAGGAYVPLDAEYPAERLALMLEDSGAVAVLSQEALSTQLPNSAARVICPDGEWSRIAHEKEENVRGGAAPENLAYVLYTSGSTGKPKGVCVEHRQLVNYVSAVLDRIGPAVSNFAMVQPLAVDSSVTALFGSLAAGRCVYIVPREQALDSAYMSDLFQRQDAEGLKIAPSHLAALQAGSQGEVMPRRLLIIGGEASRRQWVRSLQVRSPECMIFNHYGPTETTVGVTTYQMGSGEEAAGAVNTPLGKPLSNTQLYVVDEKMEPVPVGVAGELYIGGENVTRGYLNRADLTAEKFVPDPFQQQSPGRRLYKTGDRARYLAGGDVEFLGRFDDQVKLRGYRIELGEIESVLVSHAGVGQAVVVMRGKDGSSRRLVAYVVPKSEGSLDLKELRNYAQKRLPEYMVPGDFVQMEELPRSAHGKLDRNRLPEPEHTPDAEQIDPRNAEEEILGGIFAEVLKRDRVGVEQNFFEAGGHSLLATQVVSRLRTAFGVELPLRALFEDPTPAGLAERVRQARGAGQMAVVPPPIPAGREFDLPLSYAQQRMWFLYQLEPDSAAYNLPLGVHLSGELNRPALEWSMNAMVKRHEVLRTSFTVKNNNPVQVIAAEADLRVEITDLRSVDAREREAEAARMAREESARPFNLLQGPMLRARLLQLEDQEHVLLVTMHHIASDGWSRGIMVREFAELYASCIRGEQPQLPELKIQYADFAVWQRQWMQGEVMETQLEYWRRQLENLEPLDLPTDHPRPALMSQRGAAKAFFLQKDLSEKLKELSRQQGVTLFMTLLAGLQLVLSKYAGRHDVAVGTPVANRNRAEAEGLIGFFVNTLVLRTRLNGNPSFAEVLKRVRHVALDAYQFQDVPFEKLVEELQPERDMSRSPLFQVLLVLQNTEQRDLEMPGLRLSGFANDSDAAKFDLQLVLSENDDGIAGELTYACDLYEPESMDRLLGHLHWLLETMAADPEQRTGELSLLQGREREQVLVEWNRTEAIYPSGCMHELFERQAATTPDALAVEHEGRPLSYGELNVRAGRLAHYLRKMGVRPEARVAICMERSPEMVVALLGVLKAGGVYVALDPAYPRERLEFMIEDSQAAILLTETQFAEQFQGSPAKLVFPREESAEIENSGDAELNSGVRPENLAYVIYTSGSTGRPKGVAIAHESANVLMHWAREVFSRPELEGVLASTSICFDLSVFELFVPLSWGGSVLIAENALSLPQWRDNDRVKLVNTVPSAMAELVRIKGLPASVRVVNLAGEALQRSLVEQIYRQTSVERVLNLYGPSEDTTYSTYTWLRRDEQDRSVPIGRPVSNTQVYVLDEDGGFQPVPVGAGGELYLGGAGLARGYLNRPELTAEKFVPNPFSETAGLRLYRTGDRARWRADGQLEFLGRLDHQVKLRGYRIELGEIEAALLENAGIDQAVVVVRGEGADRRLVAYVAGEKPIEVGRELREHLSARLPEYMVPGVIMQLAELPLTPNGKIDRRALPEPERQHPEGEEAIEPRNSEEEILCGIFAEVLKLERAGVTQNFFEAGGHSLLAMHVVSRVRNAFNVDLPLRALFDAPTVAGLAERVIRLRAQGRVTVKPVITRVSREGALGLSFAQQRLWFLMQVTPGSTSYNIPLALRLRGKLDLEAFKKGIREIVRRHEVLRTRFEAVDGQPRQIIEPEVTLNLEPADLSGLEEEAREEAVRQLAREEAQKPFDLQKGPMVRVGLVRLGEQDHAMLMTMHHIASDAVSTAVAVREMTALYEAYSTGQESPLPELPLQYADYAAWQRGWLTGDVLKEQAEYWKRELDQVRPLYMPVDRPYGPQVSQRGSFVYFGLNEKLTAGLKRLGRREDVTIFMVMMAAYQVLLYRYSGQQNFAVGSPIAGRNEVETEGLIGFFVNTLVLPAQVAGNPTFIEVLRTTKEKMLGAYAHQDVPFERLVDSLGIERNVNRSPLFQAMLAFQNAGLHEGLNLGGIRLEPLDAVNPMAKFDLLLSLKEWHDELGGSMQYYSDLFDESTMITMMRRFEHLLEEVSENAERNIDGIGLLSEAEQLEIETGWSGGPAVERAAVTLAGQVREHARRGPERWAVIGGDGEELSYGQLDRRSNRVGRELREQGVKAGEVVGICLPGMSEWVTAAVGVLKAGAAFVSLDAGEAEGRRKLVIEDTGVRWVVTEESRAESLEGLGLKLLYVEGEGEEAEAGELADEREEGLGCVLYRSSGQGRPESIWVSQRTLCGAGAVSVSEDERVAVSLGQEQEAGSLEALRVLAAGACVVEVRRRPALAPRKLAELLSEQASGVLWARGAELERLAREFPEALEGVRVMVCEENASGLKWLAESLPEEVVGRVYGAYGMVETGGVGTLYPLSEMKGEGTGQRMKMELVGAGKRIYLLDSELRGVPEGVVGEIYVGGEEQAWGYGRGDGGVERTAENWVPDPWNEQGGGRLYRSGDLGRRRKDGSLEQVGRRDRRALVGGVRVYEEEIEAVLRKGEGVKEATVAISEASGVGTNNKDSGPDRKKPQTKITAWVVRNEKGQSRNGEFIEELLSGLKLQLPELMVPQRVVELDELPRTHAGEVNRSALLRTLEQEAGVREYTPPGTPEEEQLVQVWEQTLEKTPIGIHDNFFNIGGDSLLATQLVARTGMAFQVELPLRRLFESPTVAQLTPIVVQLKEAGGWHKPPITRISREGVLELSFAQQRLWFLMQVMPGNTSYNIPLALRLRGNLDMEALKKGVREIVRRHEVLRTRFEAVAGKPRQIIEAEVKLNLEVTDLSGMEAGEREERIQRMATEEAQKPFDLQKGPMVRAELVRLSEQDHAMLMTMHHIVSDAVSTAVAVREMTALYAAYSAGKESPLPELPLQYADYAAWQRGWLKGEVLEEQVEYWKRELGEVKPLAMPVDRPLGPRVTQRSAFVRFELGLQSSLRLKDLSRREDVTIFMVLMAAFQVLLYRYSGQQNFAVGSPIAGRNEVGTEDLIGFFVNTLVLPAPVNGSPSFTEVLRRTKEKMVGAYAHQDVPFERLVDSLGIERDVNRSPLFQVMLAFQNAGLGAGLDLGGGVTVEGVNFGSGLAGKFELLMNIRDVEQQFAGSMQYYSDLFDESTMTTMMRRFEHLLEEVSENSERNIDGIGLLSEAERRELESGWSGWSGGPAAERAAVTLAGLVREHARRGPERWAVTGGNGEDLSYGQLDRRSNRVGRELREQGVKAGEVVGICVPGMSEWVTAVVGVLKAGAAFVSLDGGEAEARKKLVIEDTGVRWVVTEESRAESMEEMGLKLLYVEGEGEEAEASELADEREDGLGCVLYRSSGQGRPESIWVSQRTLCGAGAVSVSEDERVAVSLGQEQEAGSLEALRVLAAGACVVEVRRRPALAPRKLAELLSEQASGVLWARGAELERLAREFPEALEGVRVMVCEENASGLKWLAESLPEEVVGRVYGAYGMVETGGVGTLYPLSEMKGEGTGQRMKMELVGAGKRIYLLDSELRGVPEGVVGEIYVGGEEQAWGYGRGDGGVERTAENWVPDPWNEQGGGRLYRSGDLGRRRKDGSLEQVGRRDRRALVGGVRVYEEEIEAVLRKGEGVKEATVAISETSSVGTNNKDSGGGVADRKKPQTKITAWVVRNEKGQSQNGEFIEELLSGLKEQLPELMVPQRVVELDELPRTHAGEVNRSALLRTLEQEAGVREYTPPGTPEEEQLVQVWEQTLEKTPIGIHDNFFNIGGDSLLATQLVARTGMAFQVELPLRRLFESPTVAQLTPIVVQLKEAGGWHKPPITRVSREGALELSFAQQRLWFLMQVMPGNTSYNIPLALRLRGNLDTEAFKKGLREIVRRHEVLRTRFEAVDGKPRQIIEAEVKLNLEVTDLSGMEAGEREERIQRMATEEAQKPFDLQKGPMVRAELVRLGEQDHAMLMTMHHIVSDAVSTAVAVREMTALYAAYSGGQESPLPELPLQYADYAAWQRGWLKGEVLEEQVEYWKRELGEVKPLAMPVDRPLGPRVTQRSAFVRFELGLQSSLRLKELSRREDVTIFMVLMAAFQVLLYRYSGQQNFAVGSPIAGRNEVGTEDLIGFFVNTLVLPASVGGSPSFTEVLRRMKEKTIGAYAHQDVPFERLVDSLGIERDVNRSPLFQVMFAFQNAGLGAGLDLGGGLIVEGLNAGSGLAAKFELLMNIRDVEEQLVGGMQYYSDLFDESTMTTMMRRFARLLEEAGANAERNIDGIGLLSEAEQRELESGWSGGPAVARAAVTLAGQVREHARRGPERWAVIGGDGEELSYGELDRRSNRVGRELREQGVKAGEVVGICVPGMSEWVTAAVGVLKAGAAFVSLDGGEAEARKKLVIEDTGVRWVVTEESRAELMEEMGLKLLYVEGEGEEAEASEPALEREDGLGCVLYRSSGQGRPESIWISQRTLCGAGAVSVSEDERVAVSLGQEQEAGSLEALRVLAAGACVVEVRRRPALAPRKLAELLSEQASGVVWAKSTELERLAREFPEALEGVRVMVCEENASGLKWLAESLPEEVVGRVYGAYGMVETGGVGTLYPLSEMKGEGTGQRMKMELVGAGKRIYLLDSELRGVPEGVVGEIYVGGEEQAWGYGRGDGGVERTAENWVPDPWSEQGGGRLYRSGDLGRRRKDGSLEQVGRRDRRALVGGVRVYEEEIEAVLRKGEGVKEATVAISEAGVFGTNNKDSGPDRKKPQTKITAWVVRNEKGRSRNGEFIEGLLSGLKEQLPEVMVPQRVVELDELPRTHAGEVNRRALLRSLDLETAVREYTPPGTPEEEQLVQVWEQTLEKTPIGIHDNFFNIGGNSLMATQLVARTSVAFQVDLPLRRLFEAPTIAQLLPLIHQLKEMPAEETSALPTSLVPLNIAQGAEAIFGFHPVGGIIHAFRTLVDLLPGVSIYGLQSEGFSPSESIRNTTIESMAAYYVELIRSVQKTGPYWLIGQSSGGVLALEAGRILSRMGEEVAGVLLLDTAAPGLRPWNATDLDLINFMADGNLDDYQEELKKLEGDEQLSYAVEQLRSRKILPSDYSLDLGRRRLAVIKNNLTATNGYAPEPYSGRVVLYAAESSSPRNIEVWKEYVAGPLEVEHVAGRHSQLLEHPFVTQIAAHVQRSMADASKRSMAVKVGS